MEVRLEVFLSLLLVILCHQGQFRSALVSLLFGSHSKLLLGLLLFFQGESALVSLGLLDGFSRRESTVKADHQLVALFLASVLLVALLLPIGYHLVFILLQKQQFFLLVLLNIFLIQVSPPIDLVQLFLCHLAPVLFFQCCREGQFGVLPGQLDLAVAHCSVDEVLDFSGDWHFVAFFFQHVLVEGDVVRDETQVEGQVRVLELVAVAFFVNLVGGLLGVALDDGVEVFQSFFFVGSEFGVVQG